MELLNIKDLDLANRKVFIRCDFNFPLDEFGNISDDRRIRSAIATINYCLDQDCAVILATHMGRPKGEVDPRYSLEPVRLRLQQLLKRDVTLAKDVVGEDAKAKAANLGPHEVLLLENLRFEKGETKNDEDFAKQLADMAEFYVNDAFGVSHRAHASVEAITHFFDNDHKAAGFLLQKEIRFFGALIKQPVRPFAAIVGGSKVSGKLEALINLLPRVDKIIIGGGMAFTFLKAWGYGIGRSIVEDDMTDKARGIIHKAKAKGVKFYLPVDCVVADKFDAAAETKVVTVQEIPREWMGLDIGPATTALFDIALQNAKTIVWNGPMGVFEMDAFSRGTYALVSNVANSYAMTIVGGGDTDVAVHRAGEYAKMSYISTGGGAFLELLEGKELPALKALQGTKQKTGVA